MNLKTGYVLVDDNDYRKGTILFSDKKKLCKSELSFIKEVIESVYYEVSMKQCTGSGDDMAYVNKVRKELENDKKFEEIIKTTIKILIANEIISITRHELIK